MSNQHRFHTQTPELHASKAKLWKVFGNSKWDGCPIEYEYDFGDHWDNTVELVGGEVPTDKFVCKEGVCHPCAEDVGSRSGWNELIKGYRTGRPNREQREKIEWYETMCSNRDWMGLKGRENVWVMEKVTEI